MTAIEGSPYDDNITGDKSNNLFFASNGSDFINGGNGINMLNYKAIKMGVNFKINSPKLISAFDNNT
jgi:hypothetical protein